MSGCNICGETYQGLAGDCRCTNYGRTGYEPPRVSLDGIVSWPCGCMGRQDTWDLYGCAEHAPRRHEREIPPYLRAVAYHSDEAHELRDLLNRLDARELEYEAITTAFLRRVFNRLVYLEDVQ